MRMIRNKEPRVGRDVTAIARRCERAVIAAYRDLLDDPTLAEELGRRARERVLDEHTYRHRARQLLSLIGLQEQAGVV